MQKWQLRPSRIGRLQRSNCLCPHRLFNSSSSLRADEKRYTPRQGDARHSSVRASRQIQNIQQNRQGLRGVAPGGFAPPERRAVPVRDQPRPEQREASSNFIRKSYYDRGSGPERSNRNAILDKDIEDDEEEEEDDDGEEQGEGDYELDNGEKGYESRRDVDIYGLAEPDEEFTEHQEEHEALTKSPAQKLREFVVRTREAKGLDKPSRFVSEMPADTKREFKILRSKVAKQLPAPYEDWDEEDFNLAEDEHADADFDEDVEAFPKLGEVEESLEMLDALDEHLARKVVRYAPEAYKAEDLVISRVATAAGQRGLLTQMDEATGRLARRDDTRWGGYEALAQRLKKGELVKFKDPVEKRRVIALAEGMAAEKAAEQERIWGDPVKRKEVGFVSIPTKVTEKITSKVVKGHYEEANPFQGENLKDATMAHVVRSVHMNSTFPPTAGKAMVDFIERMWPAQQRSNTRK